MRLILCPKVPAPLFCVWMSVYAGPGLSGAFKAPPAGFLQSVLSGHITHVDDAVTLGPGARVSVYPVIKERFFTFLLFNKEKTTNIRHLKAFSKQTSKGKQYGRTDRSQSAFIHCGVCVCECVSMCLCLCERDAWDWATSLEGRMCCLHSAPTKVKRRALAFKSFLLSKSKSFQPLSCKVSSASFGV